ncbi:MAG: uroporphyrinogen decarboxylase family protein [Bacillota bacterium]
MFCLIYRRLVIGSRRRLKKDIPCIFAEKPKAIWQDIANSGAASFSLDNVEDLAEAKKIIGHRMSLKGNVPPVEVMFQGKRGGYYPSSKGLYYESL